MAMEMASRYYRATENVLTRSLAGSSCKAYAFSETGKTSTAILINPNSEAKTLSISWPAVAGKSMNVSYLRTVSGHTAGLGSNNETPSSPQVELTDPADSGQDVPTNGTFSCTIPAYSAMGIEFTN
jgi:hypothetical protein